MGVEYSLVDEGRKEVLELGKGPWGWVLLADDDLWGFPEERLWDRTRDAGGMAFRSRVCRARDVTWDDTARLIWRFLIRADFRVYLANDCRDDPSDDYPRVVSRYEPDDYGKFAEYE